jgi:transcriptional regulator with XRE-family HTH domain
VKRYPYLKDPLKEARKKKKKTYEEIACETGIDEERLRELEEGEKTLLGHSVIEQLEKYYKINIRKLLKKNEI